MLALRRSLLDRIETGRVAPDRIGQRVLARAVTADRDVPRRDRATMDGFAVAAGDDAPREIRESVVGPGGEAGEHRAGTATRVATGAFLPKGADAVVPVEDAAVADGTLVGGDASPGQHVVAAGSVVAAGETVLSAGRRLAPRDAAVLRELGRDEVPVRRRLSAALLATGTEIHAGREPDRDSEFLANLLRAWGGEPRLAGSVPDDPDRVGDRIAALAEESDVVVTTGGTGVSDADETAGALRDRAEVVVERVAMRPGSNATVARLADESAVVASLPGVPGAAFLSALVLLRPLFVGETPAARVPARLDCDLPVPEADREFAVPVEFRRAADSGGETPRSVVPFGHPASSVALYEGRYRPHRVASCPRLSAAEGVVFTRSDLAANDDVDVVPYDALGS